MHATEKTFEEVLEIDLLNSVHFIPSRRDVAVSLRSIIVFLLCIKKKWIGTDFKKF